MPNTSDHNILLGFDFGLRRIGIAIGLTLTQHAKPLGILKAEKGIPNWESIQAFIDTWQADALVVGLPYNMDGTDQPITHSTRRFAKSLETRFGLPVYFADERLTTKAAKAELFERGEDLSKADSFAAKLILEAFMQQD